MKYNYNYGFLQQWLDANKHIPRGVINEAFATSSNNRIKAWARGERAMPVLSILRFCNSFQVPLSAFFRNEDAEKDNDHAPMPVKTGDKIAPHGGYAKNTDERKRGERTAVDPTEVTITASTIPGDDRMEVAACANTDNGVPNEDGGNTQECRTGSSVPGIIVGNISDANMAAIIKLQNEHVAIVNRLLDEIGRLQNEVLRLNTELGKARDYKHEDKTYSIVAEGE